MNRWRQWRKRLAKVFIGVVLILLLLHWFEHSQVYHPSRSMDATGAELGRPFEEALFKAGDGVQLQGWFFPANTNSPRARSVMLVCHGNAGNISHRLELCQALLSTGIGVFLFDYRGYGRSRGRPSEEGTYLDAQAAHLWLRQKGFAPTNILVFGESLGGGVASELALRETVGGIVLESSFTSTPDLGAELFPWLPVRLLSRIKYDTGAKLPRIHVPILVMHSRSDSLVGFHHGERNYALANSPKLFWEINGDHNDALDDREKFVEGIEKFLRIIESVPSPAAAKNPNAQ